jgi:hypothetical protein
LLLFLFHTFFFSLFSVINAAVVIIFGLKRTYEVNDKEKNKEKVEKKNSYKNKYLNIEKKREYNDKIMKKSRAFIFKLCAK